jgi:membrane dipeptidase
LKGGSIGTDFDGGGAVDGCEDASKLEAITLELVQRGYTQNEIRKIRDKNFMRVFREVEHLAGK